MIKTTSCKCGNTFCNIATHELLGELIYIAVCTSCGERGYPGISTSTALDGWKKKNNK